jgi:hypothetical protein
VTLRAWCERRASARIGFGSVSGTIAAAVAPPGAPAVP